MFWTIFSGNTIVKVKIGKIIVDEIVIDANMDLQWPHRLSLMPPSPTFSALDPLQSGFVPWSTLYPVDKVPVPTS